jgi:CMP-N-acetylneuraminic acid synthetase
MSSTSVFLPVRKGSERVINKNTRPFAFYSNGLLELKLKQLFKTRLVEEIILSTNDEISIDYSTKIAKSDSRLKVIIRPDELALSTTNLRDLVKYVPSICSNETILWTHVTSPFFEATDYDKAIIEYSKVLNQGFDSMMSVKKIQNFVWSKELNDIVNRTGALRWPRTQDLSTLYEIDSALFICSKDIYYKEADRIGKKPFLFVQEGLKSFDVDWEDDFQLAEIFFKSLYGSE